MAQTGVRQNYATRLLEFFCAAMIAAMVILLSIQVIGRYLLNDPPDWTEELARVAFVYATFLGAALAVLRKAHLGVDILATSISVRMRSALQIVLKVIACLALIALAWYGYLVVQRLSNQPLTSVPVSKGFMFAAVPIGCVFMLFYEISRILEESKKVVTGVDPDHQDTILPRAEFIAQTHEDKRA